MSQPEAGQPTGATAPTAPTPPDDSDTASGTDPASAAAPPSRRAALMRSGLIVGVLFVVFFVILPRYIDYQEVAAAFQALTLSQIAVMTILGVIAWFLSGLVFCALIPGLSLDPRTDVMADPVGHRIERPVRAVEHGRPVGRRPRLGHREHPGHVGHRPLRDRQRAEPSVPAVVRGRSSWPSTGDLAGAQNADTAWAIAIISAIAFVVATALIIAVVRSERAADWLGRTGQRIVSWTMRRLGRQGAPDVSASIHRFRDQLGVVIRRRGLAALGTSIVSQFAWVIVLIVALRMTGVPESVAEPRRGLRASTRSSWSSRSSRSRPAAPACRSCCSSRGSRRSPATEYQSTITAGVFLYRLYYWFLPIPLAWILLKVARRGKSMLPTTAELKAQARGA